MRRIDHISAPIALRPRRPRLRLASVLAIAALALPPASAQIRAESALWPDPAAVVVESRELAFGELRYDATMIDSIYLSARLNDGWMLVVGLFEYRGALVHRWGIYVTVAVPTGTGSFYTYDMRRGDVRVDTSRLWVTDGRNTVEGGPASYRIALDFPGFACELRLENVLPPWKGGDGVAALSPDGTAFEFRALACPWGDVTGWLRMDGRLMQVKGQGLLEKALFVTPLNRLDPTLYSVYAYSPEGTPRPERWNIGMLDTTTHEAYGSRRLPRLWVAKGGQWLFATTDYTLEAGDIRQGDGEPYPAPRRIGIRARGSGFLLEAEYRAVALYNVTDVLEEIPRFLRPVVALFVRRPVYLRFLGSLEGTVSFPDGRKEPIRLYGPFEYVIVR